jgi:hypothetical protein
MKAGDAMIRPLVTVGPRDFARHAGGLMDDFGLAVLPVVGMVTRLSILQLISRNNQNLHVEAGRAAVHS